MLQTSNTVWLLKQRLIISKVLLASTLSLALLQPSSAQAQGDNKKQGLEPVAASSPPSKSAMGEVPGKTSSQLPKPESARTNTGGGSKGSESSKTAETSSDTSAASAPEKSTLPFPTIGSESIGSIQGVQAVSSKTFPSAIDIHGSAAGVLLHARKETRYDLLSPLSIWLEEGPLLVSVRRPSDMVLVATKFGDICVTAGGDALVERGEEDTLRIVNLCTNNETVFLNMHDKLWVSSPWGHIGKVKQLSEKKGKKRTYEEIDSGAVSIAPGYELVIGAHMLTLDDVKPPDSVGRREWKTLEGGHFVVAEISIDNLTQLHDLIKNLNNHGGKAAAVFAEIMKSAGQLKDKQGEAGFEKHVPAPVKPAEPKRKPPSKVPSKAPAGKPKATAPSTDTPAPASGTPSPAKPAATTTPAAGTAPSKPASTTPTAKPAGSGSTPPAK
jgi:hypothetical protein